MLVIGVDENGLGPLLGPLVVTAAAFEVERYDRDRMWAAVSDDLRADDSKQLFSRAKMASAERHTLAWLAALGADTSSHAALARSICRPLPWALPCGGVEPASCRPGEDALPLWSREPDRIDPARVDSRLATVGIRPVAVRSLVACAGAFNAAVAKDGMNKLRLDFEMMMHLLARIAAERGERIEAICGKVGSTRRYGRWLDGLGRFLWSPLAETPARSSYRLSGLGTVSFVRDADGSDLPVAVASMAGKYLRELAVRRLNAELGGDPDRPASGYRDPVTARFVEQTAARREELGLPVECFCRSC